MSKPIPAQTKGRSKGPAKGLAFGRPAAARDATITAVAASSAPAISDSLIEVEEDTIASSSASAATELERAQAHAQKTMDLSMTNTRPFSLEGYEMPAKVLQIVDGDTIVLGFWLFRNRWRARCRCARFNCAELHSTSAEERNAACRARDFVSQLILNQIVAVRFESDDKYGRPIVNVTLPDGRDLCQVMISGGYAAAYNGRGEKKY